MSSIVLSLLSISIVGSVTSPHGEGQGLPPLASRLSCFVERGPSRAFTRTGLTLPPQADAESPSARMFFAALISRSWQTPHSGQTHSRTSSGRSSTTCLQSWHVLLEGYQRSIVTRVR